MTNKIKEIAKTALMIGAMALATSAKPAMAEDPVFGVRTKVEHTDRDNGLANTRTILGISEGKASEFFKAYHYQGPNTDYTVAGLRFPAFEIGNVSNVITVFGATGTMNGQGIRTDSTLENTKLTFNAERNDTLDSQRTGFGVEQTFGNWQFGGRFDNTNTPKGMENRGLIHAIYSTQNSQYGVGFNTVSSETAGTTNSISAFQMHLGERIGERAWILYSSNNTTDTRSLSGELIIADRHTFQKGWGDWIVSGNHTDMYDRNVVASPTEDGEPTPIWARTKSGPALLINGSLTDAAGVTSSYFCVSPTYKLALTDKLTLSPALNYEINHSESRGDSQRLGGSIALEALVGPGTLKLTIGTNQAVSGDAVSETSLKAEFKVRF